MEGKKLDTEGKQFIFAASFTLTVLLLVMFIVNILDKGVYKSALMVLGVISIIAGGASLVGFSLWISTKVFKD